MKRYHCIYEKYQFWIKSKNTESYKKVVQKYIQGECIENIYDRFTTVPDGRPTVPKEEIKYLVNLSIEVYKMFEVDGYNQYL